MKLSETIKQLYSSDDYWKSLLSKDALLYKLSLRDWFKATFSGCSKTSYHRFLLALKSSNSFKVWYSQNKQSSIRYNSNVLFNLGTLIDSSDTAWKNIFPTSVFNGEQALRDWFIKEYKCSERDYANFLNRHFNKSLSFRRWFNQNTQRHIGMLNNPRLEEDEITLLLQDALIKPLEQITILTGRTFKGKCLRCGRTFDFHFITANEPLIAGCSLVPTVCPYCNRNSTQLERSIAEFIINKGFKVIPHYRPYFLNRKEIDIYLPEQKIGFEINGALTHNSGFNPFKGSYPKTSTYHQLKSERCLENGIELYHIWEHWNHEKIRDIVSSKLHLNNTRLYARKLNVYFTRSSEPINTLLESAHILNKAYPLFTCYLGETKDTPVQCFQFKQQNNNELNLIRNVSALNTYVIGGSEKLFKYSLAFIKKNLNVKTIVTYAIRDLTPNPDKSVYSRLGFKCLGDSGPTLSYYVSQTVFDAKGRTRFVQGVYKREQFMKSKLINFEGFSTSSLTSFHFNPHITEKANLEVLSIYPIYNSGCWKFEYALSE